MRYLWPSCIEGFGESFAADVSNLPLTQKPTVCRAKQTKNRLAATSKTCKGIFDLSI